jgi:hypothetical protein
MMILDGAQVADAAVQGILSRIDQLAAKIGTTAAHVWQIYIAQARVEAIRDTGMAVLLLSLAIFLATYVRGLFWRRYKTANEVGLYIDSGQGWLSGVALSLLATGALYIYSAIPEWLNPQYWAFQHLTADLKNLF